MNKFIWTSYHNKDIPLRYNLKNTKYTKLFCTTNNIRKENINHLNEYLGELCTMYYVWKNNIKSDYVGFQHYRTLFRNINTNKDILVENGWIGTINELFHRGGLQSHIIYSSIQYLSNILNIPTTEIVNKYLLNDIICFDCNMFICKWEIFNDLCKTVFGFLDYLFPDDAWKNPNNLYTYIENNINIFNDTKQENDTHWYWATNFPNNKRYIIYFFEYFIPLYINIKYNQSYDGYSYLTDNIDNNNFNDNIINKKAIVCNLYDKKVSLNDFNKWYELNNCTGVSKYFILGYKNSDIYKSYLENKGIFIGKYKYVEFIDDLNNINKDIQLYTININEYINTVSYNFFTKNKFTIRQIYNENN